MDKFGGYGIFSRGFAKRLACLTVAAALFGCALSAVVAYADDPAGGGAGWTPPGAIAIRRIGSPETDQDTPVLFNNIDCTPVTYRLVAGHDMKTGCFTETAFGMMDIGGSVIIFNGTDEGLPLEPYAAHQIIVAWPGAGDLLALNPLSTGGALMGLYRDPAGAMRDRLDSSGNLTGKELMAPPDLTLKDTSGKRLVINSQTLAFSRGGGWLAAETLQGSFVRVDLGTLSAKPFAPAYGSTGSPALLKSQVALSEDGRLVAIANDYADTLMVYDLDDCGPASGDSVVDLPPQNCRSYDYRPFVKSRISGLRLIRHLRFVNDRLLSFGAVSSDGGLNGTYELAPRAVIASLTDYIGLGDSYSSGEGAFDYRAGTDTTSNTCHQSVNSYPLLLARDLFGTAGGHSAACSGAVIDDIGDTSGHYKGQVKGGSTLDELRLNYPQTLESIETRFLPGYVAQHRFIGRWQPRVATVSIAGNDIGFGDILRNCVEPHLSLKRGGNTCYSSYEDRLEIRNLIDRTVQRWKALFLQLENEAPGMRLYVLGYPQIALSSGDCGTNVRLNRKELEFAAATVDYIDRSINKATQGSGAVYVDISRALYGHRLCEAKGYDVAMNGLTAGNDFGLAGIGLMGRESYHPNALGQELIEESILRQTHGLSAPPAGMDADDPDGAGQGSGSSGRPVAAALLDAPASGRTVYVLVPDDGMAASSVSRGDRLHIRAGGSRDGLRRDAPYSVHLDGPAGTVLGTVASDDSGDVAGSVTVPTDTIPGGHRIDLTGINQDGAPVDVTRPVYVTAPGGTARFIRPVKSAAGTGTKAPSDIRPAADHTGTKPEFHDPVEVAAAKSIVHAIHGTIRTIYDRQGARGPIVPPLAVGAMILTLLLLATGIINKNGGSGLQW